MRNQLLLLDDVDDLGRSGDIVSVKPGFARNYLVPQKKAVIADKFTLRMQAKLKAERAKRAEIDRKDSEGLAKQIEGMSLEIRVKVDPDGNMYGSVTQTDLIHLFSDLGITLERRNILLLQPIKALGIQTINLKLKEGVPTHFTLKVVSETALPEEEVQPESAEPQSQESESESEEPTT